MLVEPRVSRRPTSTTHLQSIRAGTLLAACTAAFGLFLALWPEAQQRGGAGLLLPFIAAGVLGSVIAVAWYATMHIAAHVRKPHEYVLIVLIGVVLVTVGIGTSGLSLAALFGGTSAVKAHQREFIENLRATASAVATNAVNDGTIVTALDKDALNLHASSEEEGKFGSVSGHPGKREVFSGLADASTAFANSKNKLAQRQRHRDELLVGAEDNLGKDEQEVAKGQASLFEELIAKAREEISDAAKISLIDEDFEGLARGLTSNGQALIDQAMSDISEVVSKSRNKQLTLSIPIYFPANDREAILSNPQPLAWTAAPLCEICPLILLSLVLMTWREPDEGEASVAARMAVPLDRIEPDWQDDRRRSGYGEISSASGEESFSRRRDRLSR